MGSSNEHGLFVNDGSFLERFRQLQQEQQEASKLSPVTPDGQEPTSTSGNNHHEDGSPVKSSSLAALSGRQSFSLSSKAAAAAAAAAAAGGGQKPANANAATPTNGKLAFSLKQKSRLAVNALKLGGEEDEDGEDGQGDADRRSKKLKSDKGPGASISDQGSSAAPPSDPEVRKVADKLASFVAKNGRQFENITRQKNPGDTPFRFLFDVSSAEYKYYEHRLTQEEQALQRADTGAGGGSSGTTSRPHASHQRISYSTPASALFSGSSDERGRQQRDPAQDNVRQAADPPTDSVSMMEFYMKKAAQKAAHEDTRKPGKQSFKDEMPSHRFKDEVPSHRFKDEVPPHRFKDDVPPHRAPPPPPERPVRHSPAKRPIEDVPNPEDPASYPPAILTAAEEAIAAAGKKGHHMGDYIPPEELEKFLAKCNDAMAQKAAKATAERAKIQADNVGHRLLSKMGWKEGEGLGSGKGGRSDPVQAGNVKLNNLGVGAEQPGEVTPDDDIYEQYKKRMMLGYRFRPNPLNNPRKAYY